MGFDVLTGYLKKAFAPEVEEPGARKDAVRSATAAILLEIAHADDSMSDVEEAKLTGFLQQAFSITPEEATRLVAEGAQLRKGAIDHFGLTELVRRHTSLEQRIEIVRTMWRIVYSDGRVHDYENYLVRKLADLLGLEHHVMIDAKMAVKEGG